MSASAKLDTINRIAVDYECAAEDWWDAARRDHAAWDRVSSSPDVLDAVDALLMPSADEVTVEYDVAAEILRWASGLPGWETGIDHAPHPLCVLPVRG